MANKGLLIITHLLAAGAGFVVAPRELLESDVKNTGFFEVETKRTLAAAVESLKAEGSLQVYSYKSVAAVSIERDGLLWLDARQDLIVPAALSYLLDLSALKATFDPERKLMTVHLPPLSLSDVSFEPEGARTLNGGLLSFSQAQVDELTKLNYASARKAFVKQAQSTTLVEAARRQAEANVVSALELPIRVAGLPDVKVVASFAPGSTTSASFG